MVGQRSGGLKEKKPRKIQRGESREGGGGASKEIDPASGVILLVCPGVSCPIIRNGESKGKCATGLDWQLRSRGGGCSELAVLGEVGG